MRRFTHSVASRPATVPLRTLLHTTQRQQSGVSPSTYSGDETVSTTFPGAESAATHTGSSDSHRQHRGPRHRNAREADGLLRDLFDLEKKVFAEQQRQRLSVRASELDQSPLLKVRRPNRDSTAPTPSVADTPPEKEGEAAAAAASSAAPTPVLSVPTAEETARAVSRARHHSSDGGRGVAATTSITSPAAASAGGRSASPGVPPSWAPPFTLTSELLRSSLEGPASEVAFTLEELEDTLFTQAEDSEGATAASVSAMPPQGLPSAPPPPLPAASAAPSSAAATTSPAVSETQPATAATTAAASLDIADTAELGASDKPAGSNTTPSDKPVPVSAAATAVPGAPRFPAPPLPPIAPSATPVEQSAFSAPGVTAQQPPSPQAITAKPATPSLPPLLKCRLRGAAVVVSATRRASGFLELVEALHEAITFAQSLAATPDGAVRDVRLRSDLPAPTDAFMTAEDAVEEVMASVEERVYVQLLKDRLLTRIHRGQQHGLRYVAEIQVQSTTAPAELQNFSAELALACAVHEVRYAARPSNRLDGEGRDPVRLSFCGIGSGVFPAPATVRKIKLLVERALVDEVQRARLMESLGYTIEQQQQQDVDGCVADIACGTMLSLHLLPASISTALLSAEAAAAAGDTAMDSASSTDVRAAREGVGYWWRKITRTVSQQWAATRRHVEATAGLLSTSAAAGVESPLSACVTTSQVWLWTCRSVLQPGATTSSIQDTVADAMRSAPVQRCRRSYTMVHASASLAALSSSSPRPFVMEVSTATLAQTSVTDLASKIREQPADVVLAVKRTAPLEQRLRFLASLHLTDTGRHHRVTVLLFGAPREVAEAASLTRSSASLVAAQATVGYGPATTQPCDPLWLHETVEVSVARSTTTDVTAAASAEVAAAVGYVETHWQRPCVVTATSDVSATLATAARTALAVSHKGGRGAAAAAIASSPRLPAEELRTSLFPLVVLPRDAAGVVSGAGALTVACTTQSHVTAAAAGELGIAFLAVLDAACVILCCETRDLFPVALNVLSIAALQLDASAGGVFDAADRLCGDDVSPIVSAMEKAAATVQQHQSLSFACLPLLRWMVEERLLFYQLNSRTLARFAKSHLRK